MTTYAVLLTYKSFTRDGTKAEGNAYWRRLTRKAADKALKN